MKRCYTFEFSTTFHTKSHRILILSFSGKSTHTRQRHWTQHQLKENAVDHPNQSHKFQSVRPEL